MLNGSFVAAITYKQTSTLMSHGQACANPRAPRKEYNPKLNRLQLQRFSIILSHAERGSAHFCRGVCFKAIDG
jgi:hypothetical protein